MPELYGSLPAWRLHKSGDSGTETINHAYHTPSNNDIQSINRMEETGGIKLGSVQKTLLLPLWGRAMETQKQRPLLIDKKAAEIVNSLPYDFTMISKNINKFIQAGWIARSIFFDKKIKAFIDDYPDAIVVNVGCGLDTTFDRVDNGKIQWLDLDFPDTIELRRKYISESDRRHFIAQSVFNKNWYEKIDNKRHVMLLMAGVLCYFDEKELKELFNDVHSFIPGAEIIFDYFSRRGLKVSNKKVIENGGMDKSAYLTWGTDNILEIENWDKNINVISTMPIYKELKKEYSMMMRFGMNIADTLKMMSVAHIRIN